MARRSGTNGDDRLTGRAFDYYARLRRVKRYVETHLDQPISLGEAAYVAGVDRSYFSAFFHAKVGVTFRDWLHTTRIHRARQLLQDSNYSITNVAFSVGYQNLRSFERTFKKHTGKTPMQYKALVRPA